MMLALGKDFDYSGNIETVPLEQIQLKFSVPVFEYSKNTQENVVKEIVSYEVLEQTKNIDDISYKLNYPVDTIVNSDNKSLFEEYHKQVIKMQDTNIDDFNINIKLDFFALDETYIASDNINAIYCLSGEKQLSHNNFFLINKNEYINLSKKISENFGISNQGYLWYLLSFLIKIEDESLTFSRTDNVPLGQGNLLNLAQSLNEIIDFIEENYKELFNFPITIPEIKSVKIQGNFIVEKEDESNLEFQDLKYYTLFNEQQKSTLETSIFDWSSLDSSSLGNNTISFSFMDSILYAEQKDQKSVSVKVKGFDGVLLWSNNYKVNDPKLQELEIKVPLYIPKPLQKSKSDVHSSNKKIRGQVVRLNQKSVQNLMVIIQAKKEGDDTWQVVGSAETNKSGQFTINYPYGVFIAAQAIVSLTPNSPTDISIISSRQETETISDDFLYLLIKETDLIEGSDDIKDNEKESNNITRLPDNDEMIGSSEYSQDIGSSCVNLTTPNRTLREYNYQAIVRTSDPDVSNYTLKKLSESKFELSGGMKKIDRKSVDLNHPILWNESSEDHEITRQDYSQTKSAHKSDKSLSFLRSESKSEDNSSFYQAVTVATGHILHYKTKFKADGYSLGELVYSLPLAPGQKKQIVIFDSSHSLTAGESQTITQREGLEASIVNDRYILDELGGNISESMQAGSSAKTGGVSAGLGAGITYGAFSGVLGVSGGYANSNSSASQDSSRHVSQFFSEKLYQSIMQNAESYRQLNASIVTTVREGQQYEVSTEVVANHNHCHSMTMMYFEVLRHYAAYQELSEVEECVFVPLLMTNFTIDNIFKWKDILSRYLLKTPSSTYLQPLKLFRWKRQHPLLRGFDANERIKTNYENVDFPEKSYADDPMDFIKGEIKLRVNLPRPKTRYDRIKSLPVVKEIVTHKKVNVRDTAKNAGLAVLTMGFSLFGGNDVSYDTVEEEILANVKLFDEFMQMDDNFQTVPPAQCIRVTNFRPAFTLGNLSLAEEFFFAGGYLDKNYWKTYAEILEYSSLIKMLEYYFEGKLISEWDEIFNQDIIPLVFEKIMDSIEITDLNLNLDFSSTSKYTGGERVMTLRFRGDTSKSRSELSTIITISTDDDNVNALKNHVKLNIEKVKIYYSTAFYNGTIFSGFVGDDLLDGTDLHIPLNSREKRNPREEDIHLRDKLIEHLNSHLEYYNKVLWTNLDTDRRFMLLDGFNIEIYDKYGVPLPPRSIASVVKNELISIVGNSLVFPVAAGYKVSQSYITISSEDSDNEEKITLFDHYQPLTPVQPYRISVPTSGVFMEAVQGQCDACEKVKENSSQDWNEFRSEEPTSIVPVVTPTPTITDWKAIYKDFALPLVNIQNAPAVPAPGEGLTGLNELMGKSNVFENITGLEGNQANVIRTYLSNQENAKAFAEMTKTMAMQQHNSEHSNSITDLLNDAKKNNAISDEEYSKYYKDHIEQQIDGGESSKAELAQSNANKPTLTDAAYSAADQGRNVIAERVDDDGTYEAVNLSGESSATQNDISSIELIYDDVPLIPQPNKTSCWAASMAMIESYRINNRITAEELADEVGYSLDQSYGWDRLEDVKDYLGFKDIDIYGNEYPTAATWYKWLEKYGPLYVTVKGSPSHAIIVYGIKGDLTLDGTQLMILNPWNINETFDDNPTDFNPENHGCNYTKSVSSINQDMNGGDLAWLSVYEDWRILYHPDNIRELGEETSTSLPTGNIDNTFVKHRIKVGNSKLPKGKRFIGNYILSITSGTDSIDVNNLQGSIFNGFEIDSTSVTDGEYTMTITTENSMDPEYWPDIVNDKTIWRIFKAPILLEGGRITSSYSNDITIDGNKISVKLQPAWIKSENQDDRPVDIDPRLIVIHHTAACNEIPLALIQGGKVSAHYKISTNGNIIKLVHETKRAWHTGSSYWKSDNNVNDFSIGIEIEHRSNYCAYTSAQYESLIILVQQLKDTYSINSIVGHNEIGISKPDGINMILGRKEKCPGIEFNWEKLEEANLGYIPAKEEIVFSESSPATEIYDRFFDGNETGILSSTNNELKSDLIKIGYFIDNGTEGAVRMFKIHYFTGSRHVAEESFYKNGKVDFTTSKMIKRVLYFINNNS